MRHLLALFLCIPLWAFGARTNLSNQNFSLVFLRNEGAFTSTLFGDELEIFSYKTVSDNLGNILTAWSISDGSNVVVQAAFRPTGGSWQVPGVPTTQANVLSPLGYSVSDFEIDIDNSGNAVVAWEIFNGTNTVVQAAYKPIGGTWQTPGVPTVQQNVLSQLGFSVISPVDVAIGGNLIAVVWEVNNLTNLVAQAAIKPSGGTFQQPGNPIVSGNNLSTSGFNLVTPPKVDVDNSGNVAVVWQINNLPYNVAQLATRAVGGSFQLPGTPRTQANILSPLNFNLRTAPEVTIFNNQPVVQWLLLNGSNTVLQSYD